MRKRWVMGSLAVAVLGLAGMRAADLALRRAKAWGASLPMADEPKAERVGWKSTVVSQPAYGESALLPMTGPFVEGAPPTTGDRAAVPVPDDPMGAVDSFLRRSRQEADESIKALTQEAEALKSRLQKVEEALGRWQAVAGALNQDGKMRWRREPEAEISPQLEPVTAPKAIEVPAPSMEPLPALPAEAVPPPGIPETK